MIWTLLLVPALLGVVLLIVGWRGRRIDDHPLCRRCGYDLVGTEEAMTCPECGADLSRPHALRIGHRRKRTVALAFGGLLLLGTLGGGGTLGWAAAKGFDFNPYKPLWMLKREATSSTNAQRAAAAQTEIFARLNTGKLSPSQIDGIVSDALTAQVDPNATWHAWWGDFIETAWTNGRVSNDNVVRYIKQAVAGAVSLNLTAKTRQNATIMVYISHRPMRAGRMGTFMVTMEQEPAVADDGTILRSSGGMSQFTISSGGSGRSGSGWRVSLHPGKHTITSEAQLSAEPVRARGGFSSMFLSVSGDKNAGTEAEDDHSKALATWTLPLQATLEVVPADQEMVELVSDPALAELIKQDAVVQCMATPRTSMQSVLNCRVELGDLPMDVAFEVFVRLDTDEDTAGAGQPREWYVTNIVSDTRDDRFMTLPRLGQGSPRGFVTDFPQEADRVDVVLRTSKRLAEEAGLVRVWDGEIVIEDVPVNRVTQTNRRRP